MDWKPSREQRIFQLKWDLRYTRAEFNKIDPTKDLAGAISLLCQIARYENLIRELESDGQAPAC